MVVFPLAWIRPLLVPHFPCRSRSRPPLFQVIRARGLASDARVEAGFSTTAKPRPNLGRRARATKAHLKLLLGVSSRDGIPGFGRAEDSPTLQHSAFLF